MARLPAVLRGRMRATGETSGLMPPASLGVPLLPCGLPAAPGLGVDVYHVGRGSASTGWFPGIISRVTATSVVVQFGRTQQSTARTQYTDPLTPADVRRRLRLRALDGGTPSPTRAACSRPYLEGNVSEEVRAYRTLQNVAERQRSRARAEERALTKAAAMYRLCLGTFVVQLASTLLNGSLRGVRYFVELYSGPFRSISCAVQQASTHSATVTVDINPDFNPDVVADLQSWSLWRWILSEAACWGARAMLILPFHLHFSPPCTTFGRACHLHGRCGVYPGGFCDSAAGVAAVRCAFAIAFLISQLLHHMLFITYTVENPLRSRLWELPFMLPVLRRSVVLDVTYCMFGSDMRKSTRFMCHPDMRFPWAKLIPSDTFHRHYVFMCPTSPSSPDFNCCGAVMQSTGDGADGDAGSRVYHHRGRACAFSVVDANIPLHLGGCLVRAAVAARSAAHTSAGALAVPASLVCLLAAEWELEITRQPWQPVLSFSATLLSANPDVSAMALVDRPADGDISEDESEAATAIASLSDTPFAETPVGREVAVEAASAAAFRGQSELGQQRAAVLQVAAVASALHHSRSDHASDPARPSSTPQSSAPAFIEGLAPLPRRRRRTRPCAWCNSSTGARFQHFDSAAIVCWPCLDSTHHN